MNQSSLRIGVIGGGIIGSWTALHLAEAGVQATLIEQFPFPHTRGSSHGGSRAFRLLGDNTLDRLDYSMGRWRDLEKSTGKTLFLKTGLLNFGPPGDPYLEKHMAILAAGGRPYEWMENGDISSRFPMLRYPAEWGAAWDPNGGVLLAQRCVRAVQDRFVALGGQITIVKTTSIEPDSASGVAIHLTDGLTEERSVLHFDQIVVCAGPWTGKLIPQLTQFLCTIFIPVTYWSDPSGECSAANGFPVLFNARLTDVYALPSCEYPGLVKVLSHTGPEVDPDARDQVSFQSYVDHVRQYVQDHIPSLDASKPAILEPCMYTVTPDNEPIIDRFSENVVVGCGFSGSGFKHSPATGQMLAALTLCSENQLPEGYRTRSYERKRFQRG